MPLSTLSQSLGRVIERRNLGFINRAAGNFSPRSAWSGFVAAAGVQLWRTQCAQFAHNASPPTALRAGSAPSAGQSCIAKVPVHAKLVALSSSETAADPRHRWKPSSPPRKYSANAEGKAIKPDRQQMSLEAACHVLVAGDTSSVLQSPDRNTVRLARRFKVQYAVAFFGILCYKTS
jgi:hypothetical protein